MADRSGFTCNKCCNLYFIAAFILFNCTLRLIVAFEIKQPKAEAFERN